MTKQELLTAKNAKKIPSTQRTAFLCDLGFSLRSLRLKAFDLGSTHNPEGDKQ
jgi:hypothetical protein